MVSLWHHMMNFSSLPSQLLRDWDSSVEARKMCLAGWFKTLYLLVDNPRKGQRPMLRTTQAGVSGATQWAHSCGIWGHSGVLPANVLRRLPPLIPAPALLDILSNNVTSCLGEELSKSQMPRSRERMGSRDESPGGYPQSNVAVCGHKQVERWLCSHHMDKCRALCWDAVKTKGVLGIWQWTRQKSLPLCSLRSSRGRQILHTT